MKKKKNILLILSLVIMLLTPILYTVYASTISVASVAAKYYSDAQITAEFLKNLNISMSKSIFFEMSIYAIFQIINYALFLLKNTKFLKIVSLIEILLSIIIISKDIYFISIILFVPCINSLLYLIMIKKEK